MRVSPLAIAAMVLAAVALGGPKPAPKGAPKPPGKLPPKAPPKPAKGPPAPPAGGSTAEPPEEPPEEETGSMRGFTPYIPTPLAVAQRAKVLLSELDIDDYRDEADPDASKKGQVVRYRGEWHPPSAANPQTHKGISVYHRPAVWW